MGAAALAVTACGGGGDGGETAVEPATVGAGVDADIDSTTTSVPPASPGADAPAAQTASPSSPAGDPPAPAGTTVANRTEVLHEPSGLRLTFVVADKLEFSAEEPIVFELVVANTTAETRYLDSTQDRRFALFAEHDRSAPVWSDGPCRASDIEEVETGAMPLAPGEEVRYVSRYPEGDAPSGNWGEHSDCRVPPDSYVAAAQVAWCPDDSLQPRARPGDRPVCDDDATVAVGADPLRITITE